MRLLSRWYGKKTNNVGSNRGNRRDPESTYVRLRNGREIRVVSFHGGWMGPTKERPYPDFIEAD